MHVCSVCPHFSRIHARPLFIGPCLRLFVYVLRFQLPAIEKCSIYGDGNFRLITSTNIDPPNCVVCVCVCLSSFHTALT